MSKMVWIINAPTATEKSKLIAMGGDGRNLFILPSSGTVSVLKLMKEYQ